MPKAPVLSIIVRAHDCKRTIDECFKSIKESKFRDYELIVVNSGVQNTSDSIARFADKVVSLSGSCHRSKVLLVGIEVSAGPIIVNIDSDIIIRPDTLTKIYDYFLQHPQTDALTGLLSKEHPNPDFFSQYKNLYMHYIFRRLPEKVTFLYGSIFAIRREAITSYDPDIRFAEDTVLGQKLIACGRQIAFLKDLEVVHLKKYNLLSFMRNDFRVPFYWARIFLRYKGWEQLGEDRTGYAHSPRGQLASVILAPIIIILGLISVFVHSLLAPIIFLILSWFILNLSFLKFLTKERGLAFGVLSFFATFFDNLIMAAGISCGMIATLALALKKTTKK